MGGNKRTATFLADSFLNRNGLCISAPKSKFVELVLGVEADRWRTDEIDAWLAHPTASLMNRVQLTTGDNYSGRRDPDEMMMDRSESHSLLRAVARPG